MLVVLHSGFRRGEESAGEAEDDDCRVDIGRVVRTSVCRVGNTGMGLYISRG